MTLTELQEGVTIEEVFEKTEGHFTVSQSLKTGQTKMRRCRHAFIAY